MVPSSLKELCKTSVQTRKKDMMQFSMLLAFMRRLKMSKLRRLMRKAREKLQNSKCMCAVEDKNIHVNDVANEACTKQLKATNAVINAGLCMRKRISK